MKYWIFVVFKPISGPGGKVMYKLQDTLLFKGSDDEDNMAWIFRNRMKRLYPSGWVYRWGEAMENGKLYKV